MISNEERADLALEGIMTIMGAGDVIGLWPAVTSIEDALTCVAHLCDRMGLPPAETFHDALRRYRQNLEGDERAAQIADGLSTTLKEVSDGEESSLQRTREATVA